jgi:hypothetical protein
MQKRVNRYLIISQLILFIGLGICIVLIPGYLFKKNEAGVSNYGVHFKTVIPYSLAFLMCAIYVFRGALLIPLKAVVLVQLRRVLFMFSIILIVALLTTYTYKINNVCKDIHIGMAIATFCFEIIVAFWLCYRVHKDKLNLGLLAVQLLAFTVAALTLFGVLRLLFATQLLTSLMFGIILIRSSAAALKELK